MSRLYACDDFATATDKPAPTAFQIEASAAADASGLPCNGARQRYLQGYTHARQDRRDLLGLDSDYDAGFAAYGRR